MSDPSISIIIPTLGRPSLMRTLLSVMHQIRGDDEVLVIGDGPQPAAEEIVSRWKGRLRYIEGPRTRAWGHAQRNLGMERAGGKFLSFMDDDDIYVPDALEKMRRAIEEVGEAYFLFRIRYMSTVLWRVPDIARANVSTQMALVANNRDRLGTWRPSPATPNGSGGDYDFILETAYKWNAVIHYRYEIIAELAGHSNGKP